MVKKLLKKGETPQLEHTQLYDRMTRIETKIIGQLQKLKCNTKKLACLHLPGQNSVKEQQYDPREDYFKKFWIRMSLNVQARQNIEEFKVYLTYLRHKLKKIQNLFQQRQNQLQFIKLQKTKKNDFGLRFHCQLCSKKYGDEESLKIHQRVKHSTILNQEQIQQEEKPRHNSIIIYEQDSLNDFEN